LGKINIWNFEIAQKNMRLIFLIPNLILLIISGYNVYDIVLTATLNSSLLIIHILVAAISILFSILILRPLFITNAIGDKVYEEHYRFMKH